MHQVSLALKRAVWPVIVLIYTAAMAVINFTGLSEIKIANQTIQWPALVTIGAVIFVVLVVRQFMTYEGLLEEHRSVLRVTAQLGSFSANAPDPGPAKSSIRAHVFWEIWVSQDVATDKMGLNLIFEYDKPWWQFWWFWKRTKFPQVGIPQTGKDSTQHREWIRVGEFQPRKGDAVFEFVGNRDEPGDPHWLLELVLITGVPRGEYRVPIIPDWAGTRDRRHNPPL